VHLGSWKRPETENGYIGFMNYREIAPELAKYVKEMGYTHVELMPVMEHPLDESWGYQVTGYYAVTSRYGTPQDFMYFMDYMHNQGIGVILDWVPAHFPKDENGLARFDGTCLYEHLDPRQGEHPHWGTLIYNYARPQVAEFLIANALFWKDVYHADGIRMDAVASMLYLDYGRGVGQWIPNEFGGHENLQAVEFLEKLSTAFHEKKDGALLIAEESTAWKGVTGDVASGGLGFDLKWNMGWMNDFTSYMKIDPYFRKGSHGSLVFSMEYAYSERYLLAFSHDEVVHGKCSMLMKMPGDMEQKFGNLRTAYGFMMTHPGKKLQFMGQEFGQEQEWNEKGSLQWDELEDSDHKALQKYVRELNLFYQKHPALYESDYKEGGFEWISSQDADHSIIAFMRRDSLSREQLLVVCNFTPVMYENFKLGVPFEGKYKEIFNTNDEKYGGNGNINARVKTSKKEEVHGREDSITISLPPLTVAIFKYSAVKSTVAEELEKQYIKAETGEKEPAKEEKAVKGEKEPKEENTVKEEKASKDKNAIKEEKALKEENTVKEEKTPKYNKNLKQFITDIPYIKNIYIADLEYNEEFGLKLKSSIKYLNESRIL